MTNNFAVNATERYPPARTHFPHTNANTTEASKNVDAGRSRIGSVSDLMLNKYDPDEQDGRRAYEMTGAHTIQDMVSQSESVKVSASKSGEESGAHLRDQASPRVQTSRKSQER